MNQDDFMDDKNELVMKLLHYFITEKNYNPIILQGVENEIWLENLDEEYQVIRIVSGYIHNNSQFDFDIFKTNRIVKKIKKKTFSLGNMNVASFFLNLNDNVNLKEYDEKKNKNSLRIKVCEENDLKKNDLVAKAFPDLCNKLVFDEKGADLFVKITGDINKHNKEDAIKVEKVFKEKFPVLTYILIAFFAICYIVPLLFNDLSGIVNIFCVHAPSIRAGQYYRLFTGAFVHLSLFHLLFDCYSLYIVGTQVESFLGKIKFIIISIFSIIFGSLMGMIFNGNTGLAGSSSLIFGLIGALLYFGFYYRIYLGNILRSQLIPLIIINLVLAFLINSVNLAGNIAGLVGGILVSIALGVKDKTSLFEKINGWVVTFIALAFLIFLGFFYVV